MKATNINKIFETCKSFLPAEMLIADFETVFAYFETHPHRRKEQNNAF
jgi:hypothetical protein